MNIHVTIIANDQHRPGIGGADWQFDQNGDLNVRISQMIDPRYEVTLAIHEIVEAVLCAFHGITDKEVDAYDIPRDLADPANTCNRGDEVDCPYRAEHNAATACERVVAGELGVPWRDYDNELSRLPIVPMLPTPQNAAPAT
jgi:hypothetical protein